MSDGSAGNGSYDDDRKPIPSVGRPFPKTPCRLFHGRLPRPGGARQPGARGSFGGSIQPRQLPQRRLGRVSIYLLCPACYLPPNLLAVEKNVPAGRTVVGGVVPRVPLVGRILCRQQVVTMKPNESLVGCMPNPIGRALFLVVFIVGKASRLRLLSYFSRLPTTATSPPSTPEKNHDTPGPAKPDKSAISVSKSHV